MAVDNTDSAEIRASLRAQGFIDCWPYNGHVSAGYVKDTVKKHCVENEEWQKLRLRMKGIPTHEKLRLLVDWWNYQRNTAKRTNDQELHWATEVQVGNYLGALRRGGQLNDLNQVRKYI